MMCVVCLYVVSRHVLRVGRGSRADRCECALMLARVPSDHALDQSSLPVDACFVGAAWHPYLSTDDVCVDDLL